jgi:hypothetical protein
MSLTLFDLGRIKPTANADPSMRRPAPYQPASETSREAAHAIEPHAGTQRKAVYDELVRAGAGGRTRQEIADAIGMKLQSVCGRVSELISAGLAREPDGARRDKRQVVVARDCV